MHIEEIIKSDSLVSEIKEKPLVSTFILVAAVALGYLSVTFPENENLGFGMMVLSVIIALMGLKGVVWPKKHLEFKPTKENTISIPIRLLQYRSALQWTTLYTEWRCWTHFPRTEVPVLG